MSGKEGTPVIHLVDDDASFLESTAFLLGAAGFTTRAYSSAEAFLEARVEGPGCAVVDLAMSGLSGLELQAILNECGITLPIVFLTAHGELRTGVRAMRAGAEDFLSKPVEAAELVEAVRRALERDRLARERDAQAGEWARRVAVLTPRERQVLERVTAGLRSKQIAAELGLSLRTVKYHRGNIMDKFGARNVAQLVAMAGDVRRWPVRG
jgi:FixJ family two-component response regulator